MQTQTEIREILQQANLAPQKAMGQNFLIDHNLMGKLLELADLSGTETVLEVGPGTGSLTEELLSRCRKLVAVELDRGLGDVLDARLGGRENFKLVRGDILESKHRLSGEVLAELSVAAAGTVHLVSNLPYNVATPLIAQCLIDSWHDLTACNAGILPAPLGGGAPVPPPVGDSQDISSLNTRRDRSPAAQGRNSGSPVPLCRFERLTFTVQREVADRLTAGAGQEAYGIVSIVVALLGAARCGPVVPATAFWPAPTVASRIVRIDFDPAAARAIRDVAILLEVVNLAFAQRRKQIGSILRRAEHSSFSPAQLKEALEKNSIDPTARPERITPAQFLTIANALATETNLQG